MRRSVCIWLGFIVLLALTTFPPWTKYQLFDGAPQAVRTRVWHARADKEPQIERFGVAFVDVDYRRMWTEIAGGECFVLALFLTWGRKEKGNK